jgi:hypothetical protein
MGSPCRNACTRKEHFKASLGVTSQPSWVSPCLIEPRAGVFSPSKSGHVPSVEMSLFISCVASVISGQDCAVYGRIGVKRLTNESVAACSSPLPYASEALRPVLCTKSNPMRRRPICIQAAASSRCRVAMPYRCPVCAPVPSNLPGRNSSEKRSMPCAYRHVAEPTPQCNPMR